MKTNDLKKGANVMLKNGWRATIEDNQRGNIRMATVYGHFTEMGSIYAWDIDYACDEDWKKTDEIELTEKQTKDALRARSFFP